MGHLEIRPDPGKMTQLASGALTFLRAGVRAARQVVRRSYTTRQVHDSLRMPRAEWPYYTPGFPLSIPLRHGSRVAGLAGGPTDPFEPDPGGVLLADTSELAWYRPPGDKGLVTVETERSQALIGHVKANRRAVRNLAADLDNDFAALVATSLGEPLARARRILLTAGARAGNTGMQWNEARTSLTDWGKAPTRKK